MSIYTLQHSYNNKLREQYHSNVEDVLVLQSTMILDILPSLVDELELGADATEWAREWLKDTSSMFRIARRNNFTRSFALESIRKNLVWRLHKLWPAVPPARIHAVHCLPDTVRDPFGRPILVVEALANGDGNVDSSKADFIQGLEHLRQHLQILSERARLSGDGPVLQYTVIVDLKSLSIHDVGLDMISWAVREVIPRFSGMIAAVFMVNSTWAHSGLWSVVKRLLPVTAGSRTFFPSQKDLIEYFTPAALPKDYGGTLDYLSNLIDPLQAHQDQDACPRLVASSPPSTTITTTAQVETEPIPTSTRMSPTSILNPFFGYPVLFSRGSPSLEHGRRRKRDLVRTLLQLLWMRWRTPIMISLSIAAFGLALAVWSRRMVRLRLPRGITAWKFSSSSV